MEKKRSTHVPVLLSGEDIEFMLMLQVEFDNAAEDACLRLNTPQLKVSFYHQCLMDTAKTDWDNARANNPGNTDNAFNATCLAFIATFLDDNDITDQDHYLKAKKKPKGLFIVQFVVRLQAICSYMHWFPETDVNIPYDKQEYWILFFKMMPEDS